MIGAYLRVSTDKQEHANQRPDLERWLASQAPRARAQWYMDTSTGKNFQRPGLDRIMEDCERGKIKVVVVWKLDRLGRSVQELFRTVKRLQALGVRVVSVHEQFDLSTPAGRLMFGLLAVLAEFEIDNLSLRIRAGLKRKRASGWRPLGRRAGTRIRLTPEKETTIRQLRAAGKPLAQIARIVGLNRRTCYRALEE